MLANYDRSAQKLTEQLRADGISDTRVLEAIASTPRHQFIDSVLLHKAYLNTALPIGQGQTISQPYIVALMTQCLLTSGDKQKV